MPPLTPHQEAILKLFVVAAAEGADAPTNAAIARRLGVRSNGTASVAVRRLEQLGLIKVERCQSSRIVTVIASGTSTANRTKTGHSPRRLVQRNILRDQASSRFETAPSGPFLRVDRDPCPRCATRGDIGCAHRPAREPYFA